MGGGEERRFYLHLHASSFVLLSIYSKKRKEKRRKEKRLKQRREGNEKGRERGDGKIG